MHVSVVDKSQAKKVTMGTPHIDTELEKLCMFAISICHKIVGWGKF